MKTVIRVVALSLLMLPAFVSAQEPHPLAGTWSVTTQADGAEPKQMVVEFRIQGDAVTGPIMANGFERYITQGTATANSISFTSPGLNADDQDQSLTWTGQLSGDGQLTFSIVRAGQDAPAVELTLTRHVAE